MRRRHRGRIGSSFDDFLKEEGLFEECQAVAIEEIAAMQEEQEAPDQGTRPGDQTDRSDLTDPSDHTASPTDP